MRVPIQSAPLLISDHAEVEMTPSVNEICRLILKEGLPTVSAPGCAVPFYIGLFSMAQIASTFNINQRKS